MIKLTRKYENGHEREFTVQSAQFANEDENAAIIYTKESAGVIISESDTPELWQQAIEKGVKFDPYQPPVIE